MLHAIIEIFVDCFSVFVLSICRMSRPPVIRTKAEVQAKLSLLEVCALELLVSVLLKSLTVYVDVCDKLLFRPVLQHCWLSDWKSNWHAQSFSCGLIKVSFVDVAEPRVAPEKNGWLDKD